jgi:hypothetical protein
MLGIDGQIVPTARTANMKSLREQEREKNGTVHCDLLENVRRV